MTRFRSHCAPKGICCCEIRRVSGSDTAVKTMLKRVHLLGILTGCCQDERGSGLLMRTRDCGMVCKFAGCGLDLAVRRNRSHPDLQFA